MGMFELEIGIGQKVIYYGLDKIWCVLGGMHNAMCRDEDMQQKVNR